MSANTIWNKYDYFNSGGSGQNLISNLTIIHSTKNCTFLGGSYLERWSGHEYVVLAKILIINHKGELNLLYADATNQTKFYASRVNNLIFDENQRTVTIYGSKSLEIDN